MSKMVEELKAQMEASARKREARDKAIADRIQRNRSRDKPARFDPIKTCVKCGETKTAANFSTVPGGGTGETCKACKNAAIKATWTEKREDDAEYQRWKDEQLRLKADRRDE